MSKCLREFSLVFWLTLVTGSSRNHHSFETFKVIKSLAPSNLSTPSENMFSKSHKSASIPWFKKDMEVGDLSIQLDPDSLQKIASQINLRYKRATNTCTEHKRKHQRCPPDCIGRRKEQQAENAPQEQSNPLSSQVIMENGKEKMIVGIAKSDKEKGRQEREKEPQVDPKVEDSVLHTLITKFHTFVPSEKKKEANAAVRKRKSYEAGIETSLEKPIAGSSNPFKRDTPSGTAT